MEYKTTYNEILGLGISEQDAMLLADCIATNKSCSWVNNDDVDRESVRKLVTYIQDKQIPIDLSIKHLETRNKYIWEVRIKE